MDSVGNDGSGNAGAEGPAWELKKENVAPLRKGRRDVQGLSARLQEREGRQGVNSEEEGEKRKLWDAINSYQGIDPLEPWLRLISWTKKQYLDSRLKMELLPVLEQCTKSILDSAIDKYRGDLRYLRVWIQYADLCSDPTEIFNFLRHREIGQNFALYYEARATFYELKGNHAKALDTYQEGLNRLAQPIARLENKMNEFQHRMHRRIQRGRRDDESTAALIQSVNDPERQTLARVHTGGLQAQPSSQRTRMGLQGNVPQPTLNVYEESPGMPSPAQPSGSVLWSHLATQNTMKRENQGKPENWRDFRLPQHGTAATAPVLDVMCDDDLADGGNTQPPPPTTTVAAVTAQPSIPSRGRNPMVGFDNGLLVGPDGEEQCFEEARLALWISRHGQPSTLPSPEAEVSIGGGGIPMEVDKGKSPMCSQREEPAQLCAMNMDPTVTINTKEAFNDIMSMFSEDLPCDNQSLPQRRKRKPDLGSEPEEASEAGLEVFDDGNQEEIVAAEEERREEEEEAIAGADSLLQIYEDTALIPPIGDVVQDEDIPDEQENTEPHGGATERPLPARSLADAGPSSILQSLSDRRRDLLGVQVSEELIETGFEDGEPIMQHPEQILRTAETRSITGIPKSPEGDAFSVWCGSLEKTMSEENPIARIPRHSLENESNVDVMEEGEDCLIDPFDADLCSIILDNQQCPIVISDHSDSQASEQCLASLEKLKRTGKAQTIMLGDEELAVEEEFGRGGYAVVYRALGAKRNGKEWDVVTDEDDSMSGLELALKVQPGNETLAAWEVYVGREVFQRLGSEAMGDYLTYGEIHRLISTKENTMVLIGRCTMQGSMQSLLNAYLASKSPMDESVVMYYTMELLRIVSALHSVGIQHGDIKPDNIMLRNDSSGWEDWGPGRPGSWSGKGVVLCDWGRAIDMQALNNGPFRADALSDSFRTFVPGAEPDKAWTFAADSHGICGVVHCMLFGKYMSLEVAGVDATGSKLYRPTEPMKRNHHVELWHDFFDLLLNPEPGEARPPLDMLHSRFESHLSEGTQHRKELKKLLMKQNIMMMNQ